MVRFQSIICRSSRRTAMAVVLGCLAINGCAASAQEKRPKELILGKWKSEDGDTTYEFLAGGYVHVLWNGANFFQTPDYVGNGYKLRWKIGVEGKDNFQIELTVMELHTRREVTEKVKASIAGDKLKWEFSAKPSELGGLALVGGKQLTRVQGGKK